MKSFLTTYDKPYRNGIYQNDLSEIALKALLKIDKLYKKSGGHPILLKNLKKNSTIFYFASEPRCFTKPLLTQTRAYSSLKNSGVAEVNKKGEVHASLKCPQIYIFENGKVYSRHCHFIYWDEKMNDWDSEIYTQLVFCPVNRDFVKKNMKKAVLVDARSSSDFEKGHIKGAISLPATKKWTSNEVMKKIMKVKPRYEGNKEVPMIIYSYKDCDYAEKTFARLNKLGFHNTVHYENGMSDDW